MRRSYVLLTLSSVQVWPPNVNSVGRGWRSLALPIIQAALSLDKFFDHFQTLNFSFYILSLAWSARSAYSGVWADSRGGKFVLVPHRPDCLG